MGVAYGSIPNVLELLGRPLPDFDKLFINWCTAALAIPYPIMPCGSGYGVWSI